MNKDKSALELLKKRLVDVKEPITESQFVKMKNYTKGVKK